MEIAESNQTHFFTRKRKERTELYADSGKKARCTGELDEKFVLGSNEVGQEEFAGPGWFSCDQIVGDLSNLKEEGLMFCEEEYGGGEFDHHDGHDDDDCLRQLSDSDPELECLQELLPLFMAEEAERECHGFLSTSSLYQNCYREGFDMDSLFLDDHDDVKDLSRKMGIPDDVALDLFDSEHCIEYHELLEFLTKNEDMDMSIDDLGEHLKGTRSWEGLKAEGKAELVGIPDNLLSRKLGIPDEVALDLFDLENCIEYDKLLELLTKNEDMDMSIDDFGSI